MSGETIVLLVDDNPTNLEVLYQTLDGHADKLLVATSGEDAIKIARKAQPDLVLLDIMMPRISGFETCEALKADPRTADAAVIFLSALDQTADKVRGLELGAVDYVTKPFQAEEVIARVKTHLEIKRLQRELAARYQELSTVNLRMKEELRAAARVQRALLPPEIPQHHRCRFAFRFRPCDELAGDALNVFAVDDQRMYLYLLDVSGHGVPAALLSVAVTRALMREFEQAASHSEISSAVDPGEIAVRMNATFPMAKNDNRFFTLMLCVLDTSDGLGALVSAGHPGPVLVRGGQDAQVLDIAGGVPIGILEDAQYEKSSLQLQPGDRLYFLSDGLYEQRNEQREAMGMERLLAAFDAVREGELGAGLDYVIEAVDEWRGARPFDDDISILALEFS
jgi:sigma-B regulation protein RsbU (phosphoserine phosphatase)